nr:unnamed protein product [Callosobruchus chinensis]
MMHTISGKAHKSKTGKQIEAKVMKEGCAQCKKKCTERINQHTRENIFENYWSGSKSWDIKRQFILAHVKSKPPSRKRPVDGSRGIQRKQTISYSLTINNGSVAVCKVFFHNTLGISETVVRNALKKQEVGGFVSMDMRGRHVLQTKFQNMYGTGFVHTFGHFLHTKATIVGLQHDFYKNMTVVAQQGDDDDDD